MSRSHRLGELQLAIMRVLWSEGEATVAAVHEALKDQGDRALTTIATMLKKMEAKGVVTHRTDGRQFVYRPTVSEEAVRRTMVRDLTSSLFAGDVAALVTHLIAEERIDADELAELRAKIAEREAQEGDA
ncbi:MAG: BlaI/MecI/CopY family transcriptional regulator [Planctomycetes bacterium]|nr:BlaI/MecI/CopY family transcriptional regulator [Planctomycetota bacterium]MCB9905961.1 BlaI/MecI/CopY family transcriptional regulator [Planctomycetota bacterium]